MSTLDKSTVEVELLTEEIVAKIVKRLMTERDEWQAYLDAIPAGQSRAGYSIGYRDAVDAMIDDVTQRRWEDE